MNELPVQDLNKRRDEILSAVGYATSELLRSIDWKTALNRVLERLGTAASANRAYFFENRISENGRVTASQLAEWTAPGVAPQIHNPDLQDVTYKDVGMERWAELMRQRQPVHGLVHEFPESERELLESQDIRSLFVMPVFSGANWAGFLGFDDCENQRHWSRPEFDALFASAAALGAAIERQRLEQELRFVQKMDAVGGLASGIAHDFNNVLQAIVSLAQVAKLEIENGTQPVTRLDEIVETGTQAGSLTQQLLVFCHKQEAHSEIIGMRKVVHTVESMLKPALRRGRIELSVKIADPEPTVYADASLLSQVILNLCLNGCDAMPETGTLQLECDSIELRATDLVSHDDAQEGEYMRCTVTDTGHGMEPSVCDKIFEPFFTTKKIGAGTGLGLSVARTIVSNFGGFISVDSAIDVGTSFSVYIPLAPDASATTRQPGNIAAGIETVLLVEDEPVLLRGAQRLLEAAGYTVIAAANGSEGLQQFKLAGDKIDIVITDYLLPVMDGVSMVQSIRRTHPDMKVIVMSGAVPEELPADSCLFLQKPVRINTLIQTIRDLL
jgi:signal transduction histidine kinase/CheY-like chemotaxis protein